MELQIDRLVKQKVADTKKSIIINTYRMKFKKRMIDIHPKKNTFSYFRFKVR